MNFEEWEPYYREICEYFAFDPGLDEDAARVLATLLRHDDLPLLDALSRGQTVTVCGNAPRLQDELDRITGRVFAADAAAEVLMAGNIRPDAVFTDLDGATGLFPLINEAGTVMVVHAHGDNIPLIRFWMPQFPGPVVATTQGMPFDGVHNFGGFTDGDRAVFAAHALGAHQVCILGFDLDDQDVDPMKRGKLWWARRLLALLGHAC
jgi:uncharacterized Rossmann fold enzyme